MTYKPLTATDDKNLFKVDATAVKIDKGSIDDFKNISLDENQKTSTRTTSRSRSRTRARRSRSGTCRAIPT